MRKLGIQILFFCLITSSGLIAQEREDAYFNQIADEICDCSSEMAKGYHQMVELQKNGGSEQELMILSQKIEKATADFENCVDKLEQKYPDIDGNKAFEQRAEKALAERCRLFEDMNASAVQPKDIDAESLESTGGAYDLMIENEAKRICDCSSELSKYSKQFEEIYKDGETNDEAQLKALDEQLEKTAQDFEKCIGEIILNNSEYENNPVFEAKVEKVLAKTCPFFTGMDKGHEEIEHADRAEIDELVFEDHDIEEGEVLIEDVTPVNTEYNDFATDICNCLDTEAVMMGEFKALKAEGDEEKLSVFRKTIPNNYPTVITCLEKVVTDNPNIDVYDHSGEKKKAAIKETCPLYLELLGIMN